MVDFVVDPGNMLFQFLTVAGDGTGAFAVTGDYSVTPENFYIMPPTNKTYIIQSMTGYIREAADIASNGYGGLTARTNGLNLTVKSGGEAGTVLKTLTPDPVKIHNHWKRYSQSATLLYYGSIPAAPIFSFEWTFLDNGTPLVLHGDHQDALVLTASDTFATIDEHTFFCKGLIRDR